MNRVLVVAPTMVHMKNWAREMKLPPNFLLYVDDPKKLMAIERGIRYVWIDNPTARGDTDKIKEIFKVKGSVRLPIDINDWPLDELPHA